MEKREQSLKKQTHHRLQHTTPVHNLLTSGMGIEKKGFFLASVI